MPECPVCKNELEGGTCPHCAASARIQEAYIEISRIQGRRMNVDGAVRLLARARELLEEKDYGAVDDFLEGARAQAAEAEAVQGPMRKAIDRAAEGVKKLRRSGKDTHRLEQAMKRAEKFIQDGDLEGAQLLVKRLPAFIRELQGPAMGPTGGAAPNYLSSCPSCSKHVMKAWRKCPHCLAPLTNAPSPQGT
jgi:flagellin-specific chaperone FliS